MNNYPCLGCWPNEGDCPCDLGDCFGGERDEECLYCSRYEKCCIDRENRHINKSDEDDEDRRLFNG